MVELDVNLLGAPTHVQITVTQSYAATINFTLFGKPYTFTITKWQARGQANFIRLFYSLPRDANVFGAPMFNDEGMLVQAPSVRQKTQAIIQACQDVLACVNAIFHRHGRSLLDYAVWYRERHPEEDTYSQYITKITAHCIVHADLLAPNVAWELVLFTPPAAPAAAAGGAGIAAH